MDGDGVPRLGLFAVAEFHLDVFEPGLGGDDFAVFRDCAHGAVQGQHRAAGIAKRALQEIGAAQRANFAQVGRDSRASAVDAMAIRAAARSFEPGLSSCRVALRRPVRIEIAHVADVGHDRGDFGGIKPEGRHGRPGDAIAEHGAQILVGGSAAQLAAAQIHAADLRAIHAVAGRALRGVNLRAIANVRRSIGDGAILSATSQRE